MTEKLYDQDAYQTSFTAGVLSCDKCPDADENEEKYMVILDSTCFFPEEGGQTPDRGILGGFPVTDVQIKGGEIIHTIDASRPLENADGSLRLSGPAISLPKPGDTITGEIDWDHRYSNMQQHTGEHVFSGLVHSRFGYDNVGFHLSDSIVTMDYNGPITSDEIRELEKEANRVITRQIPVETGYPDDSTLSALDYRCKKELTGAIRIVTIPGVDTCACCAPHLHNTGEIGLLKVLDVQSHKGGVRISILCGFRALGDYRMALGTLREISRLTSAPIYETAGAVSRLQKELEETKYALGRANRRLLSLQTDMLEADCPDPFIFTEGVDTASVRDAVNELTARFPGYCGVFNGNGADGYSFIIGSRDLDCNIIAKALREHLSAKCGGKPVMIQGQVRSDRRAILDILHESKQSP